MKQAVTGCEVDWDWCRAGLLPRASTTSTPPSSGTCLLVPAWCSRTITDTLNDSMWGMPIGEFFDLEALAKHAAETGRYTFFFSSWPLNVCVHSSANPYVECQSFTDTSLLI